MGEVTFLGLGAMGAAIATAAVKAGFDTTIWNRSPARAEDLLALGASYRPEIADAIGASDIIVVCVSDYAVTHSILETPGAAGALRGKTLIQLSSGSPRAANQAAEVFAAWGLRYLDGALLFYVDQVGAADAHMLVSGDSEAFSASEKLLATLAPQIEYLGAIPGQASALDSAILCSSLGQLFGTLNGAALCEASGVSMAQYQKYIPLITQDVDALSTYLQQIADDDPGSGDTTIEGWGAIIDPMIETLSEAGYNAQTLTFFRRFFDRAVESGMGRQDIGSLIKLLRPES